MHLQGCARGVGRLPAPQLVDQALAGHDVVRVQQEQRKQSALLGTPELQEPAFVFHLERSEDPELHASPLRL